MKELEKITEIAQIVENRFKADQSKEWFPNHYLMKVLI